MFQARIKRTGDGLDLGSDYMRHAFKVFMRKNPGLRMRIEPILPESRKQRGYLEGGLIPLLCFYQEGMNHQNPDDIRRVRGWLHTEFSSEMVVVAGKVKTVAKSTKGRKELNAFVEKVSDFIQEQYAPPPEATDTKDYKRWIEEIFPFEDGPDNFIDYLVSTGKLKQPL